jgi:chemotaxis protein MotB
MLKSVEAAFFGICRGRRTLSAARCHRGQRFRTSRIVRKSILFVALVLSACVSQGAYNEQAAQLKEARARAAAEQAEIAKMQTRNRWVMAGDLLFPEGGYRLSPAGEAALSQYLSQLRSLQNTKVVVYGFTDNSPVGPELQRAGIANNVDLSSRRADAVVAYFVSQGVNPNILSAKGFGERNPIAPNAAPQGRAQNRRIEIVLEGAGA